MHERRYDGLGRRRALLCRNRVRIGGQSLARGTGGLVRRRRLRCTVLLLLLLAQLPFAGPAVRALLGRASRLLMLLLLGRGRRGGGRGRGSGGGGRGTGRLGAAHGRGDARGGRLGGRGRLMLGRGELRQRVHQRAHHELARKQTAVGALALDALELRVGWRACYASAGYEKVD